MLVPLVERMLHSYVASSPGTVMKITTGAMQNTSADTRDATMLLHFDERNRVKLTETKTESSPVMADRRCNYPMFNSASVTMEYSI